MDIICLCICSYLSRLYLLLYLQFIHIGPLLITLQWLLILKKAIAVCRRIMWDGKGESNELWVFLPPLCFFFSLLWGPISLSFQGLRGWWVSQTFPCIPNHRPLVLSIGGCCLSSSLVRKAKWLINAPSASTVVFCYISCMPPVPLDLIALVQVYSVGGLRSTCHHWRPVLLWYRI